jgi:uncharacterized repeat protein (TIGR01451 family)
MQRSIKILFTWLVLSVEVFPQVVINLPDTLLEQQGILFRVPLNVNNFNNISAISLKINYDPASVEFVNIYNPAAGGFFVNASDGVITIAWASLQKLNIQSGILFELEFKHLQGNTQLNFIDGECELADFYGMILNLSLENGSVNINPQSLLASIGNKVWVDLNKNGIQNFGEPGLAWVTAELYTCTGNYLGFINTDQNGMYTFNNLNPGGYYIRFTLPAAYNDYIFTSKNSGNDPEKDSDADPQTGMTECFTLYDGQNELSVDAGVYQPQALYPLPEIKVSDYLIFNPPLNSINTYQIVYKNKGESVLLNASVIDTLPQGLTFIDCSGGINCGETSPGSGIITADLGNLIPSDSGIISVTVKTSDIKSDYKNICWLTGNNSAGMTFSSIDYDLNLSDSCTSAGVSGIESNSDFSENILKTQKNLFQNHYIHSIQLSKRFNQFQLPDFIPAEGPFNSFAIETTPADIYSVSNAIDCYAVDYFLNDNGTLRRVGAIFSTTTNSPDIYVHSKVVCDRLKGYKLEEINLYNINGYEFFIAELKNENNRLTDYSVSFSAYYTGNEFKVQSKWTNDEYYCPTDAIMIYNFQIWSSSKEETASLLKKILEKIQTYGSIVYLNTNQKEPVAFFSEGAYKHSGNFLLRVKNKQLPASLLLNYNYRFAQGGTVYDSLQTINISEGDNEFNIPFGIVADSKIKSVHAGGFKDDLFLSGGTYIHFEGETSLVDSFHTAGFPKIDLQEFPQNSLVLSGGAKISGQLNDWVCILRSLTSDGSAYDLSDCYAVRFNITGSGLIDVFLEMTNTQNYNYYTHTAEMNPSGIEIQINFNEFQERFGQQTPFDASLINAVGFIYDKDKNPAVNNFSFEIKNIAFLREISSTGNEEKLPQEFKLSQNYPNPFNPATKIDFSVAKKERVVIKIFDIIGQEVSELVNEELNPGYYSVTFNAENLSSGIYIYSMISPSISISKKMILLK